jgi:hypothetical protein
LFVVLCTHYGCQAMPMARSSKTSAIESWNRRVALPPAAPALDRAAIASAPQPAAISNSDLVRCGPMDENDWKDQRIQSLEDYIAELKKSTAEPQEKA